MLNDTEQSWAERREAIEQYERLGLQVFPYHFSGGPWPGWNQTPRPPQNREIALQPGTAVYGVALDGRIVVIDLDADRGGDVSEIAHLPPTLMVQSPGSERNRHLFYRVAGEPLRKGPAMFGPGIDLLGLGQHVKGATSRRAGTLLRYFFVNPGHEVAELPAAVEQQWRGHLDSAPVPAVQVADEGRVVEGWKQLSQRWADEGIAAIAASGDGTRRDAMFKHTTNIVRNANLLGVDMDERIRDAYVISGGKDSGSLEWWIETAHAYAVEHPKPVPSTSNPVESVNEQASEWVNGALRGRDSRATVLPKLVHAAAAEAVDGPCGLVLPMPLETLRSRHGVTSDAAKRRMAQAVKVLRSEGWLAQGAQRPGAWPWWEHHLCHPVSGS